MLGLKPAGSHTPRFVRRYADLSVVITDAVTRYVADVVNGEFPTDAESFAPADEPTPIALYR